MVKSGGNARGPSRRFDLGKPQRVHFARKTHQAPLSAANRADGSSQVNWCTSRATPTLPSRAGGEWGAGSPGRMSIAHGLVTAFCAGRQNFPPALLK